MTGSGAPDRVTWLVVLMTALLFVNYVDRGNLATVGPLLIDQQGLSNAQLGLLLSAFYFSYAPAQLLAGWLCERTDVYRLLAFGVALWSLTTAATVRCSFLAGMTTLIVTPSRCLAASSRSCGQSCQRDVRRPNQAWVRSSMTRPA